MPQDVRHQSGNLAWKKREADRLVGDSDRSPLVIGRKGPIMAATSTHVDYQVPRELAVLHRRMMKKKRGLINSLLLDEKINGALITCATSVETLNCCFVFAIFTAYLVLAQQPLPSKTPAAVITIPCAVEVSDNAPLTSNHLIRPFCAEYCTGLQGIARDVQRTPSSLLELSTTADGVSLAALVGTTDHVVRAKFPAIAQALDHFAKVGSSRFLLKITWAGYEGMNFNQELMSTGPVKGVAHAFERFLLEATSFAERSHAPNLRPHQYTLHDLVLTAIITFTGNIFQAEVQLAGQSRA
ncbi:hypothetical protein V8D89_006660 [Ganoderma adspersum]